MMPLTFERRLDPGDVDLAHPHHGVECALGGGPVWVVHGLEQHPGRDLPRDAPLVLAPAADAFLAAVADDGLPQTVGLGLILRADLERKCLAVLERGPRSGRRRNTGHGELDSDDIAGPARRVVARCVMHCPYCAVGEGLGVKVAASRASSSNQRQMVFCWALESPRSHRKG